MVSKLCIFLALITLASSDCADNCPNYYLGDGFCHSECNIYDCSYDEKDCLSNCMCDLHLLDDGNCNKECYNSECSWDYGDCDENQEEMNTYIYNKVQNVESKSSSNDISISRGRSARARGRRSGGSGGRSGSTSFIIGLCVGIPCAILMIVLSVIRYRRRMRFNAAQIRVQANQGSTSAVIMPPPPGIDLQYQNIEMTHQNQQISMYGQPVYNGQMMSPNQTIYMGQPMIPSSQLMTPYPQMTTPYPQMMTPYPQMMTPYPQMLIPPPQMIQPTQLGENMSSPISNQGVFQNSGFASMPMDASSHVDSSQISSIAEIENSHLDTRKL